MTAPFSPYAIHSLQGYLGELVRSSGTDIILDDILTILHEHYNNVKALDALNQELFQLRMGEKETVSDRGAPIETPSSSHGIIPGMIPTRPCSRVKAGPLLWWATKAVKGNGGLPEGHSQ